jgi:hypothetical protein
MDDEWIAKHGTFISEDGIARLLDDIDEPLS